ncbi:hypothetical protein GCM10022243_03570 [Saccharothrix violaceirubra]|uniref:Cell division protein FtsQ n=1 Tax=Saccharothrix violaceirubra TaxID=413306 RepID=A0A7W7T094_9PSEU|nr:FtsQ-type POTRA domain-containing protein [Saccharothrix violaceirubra]MBB4964105.1 cell division protein FtsQ [Saccharothrix violaceirubra]
MSDRTARRRTAARRRPSGGLPTRATALRRRAVALLTALTVIGVVVVVWFTPTFGVREVAVDGLREMNADEVRAAAAVADGSPLVRLDVEGIASRVRALPRVGGVTVERELPGTVRLTVDERDPVGVIKATDGVHLVDETGKDYATVAQAPIGLPELKLGGDDRALVAAVGVLIRLPDSVRTLVQTVSATTPADVTLHLTEGREARWGTVDDTPRKADVLLVLLTRKGSVFDVTSPELPTVS